MKEPAGLEKELKPLLAHANDANPVWCAVNRLLEHDIEAAIEGVCSPGEMTAANYQRGELAALRQFRARLRALRERSREAVK